MPADLSLWGNIVFNSFWKNKNFLKLYSLSFFSRAGGGSGGGLDRGVGGVGGGSQGADEADVLGLGRDLHLTLVPPFAT